MNGSFDPDRFNKFLKEQAKLIRESSLDIWQIKALHDEILYGLELWRMSGLQQVKNRNEMQEAFFELNLSFHLAYSNYQRENKNMWTAIFGWTASRIPQFNPEKLLLKK
ncbi:MAG: hypothetical protein V1702_01855 [Candidatus Woesearchaeota archaeon]